MINDSANTEFSCKPLYLIRLEGIQYWSGRMDSLSHIITIFLYGLTFWRIVGLLFT
jgi:hypothetical protein